ncbi:MAG: RNA methyltransferase substrate-binding domain-containing protein, partial [Acidimicrobiales bacterium]
MRQSEGVFVLEGSRLVSVALEAGVPLEGVYVAPAPAAAAQAGVGTQLVLEKARSSGIRVHDLAEGIMERVSDTVTPQ